MRMLPHPNPQYVRCHHLQNLRVSETTSCAAGSDQLCGQQMLFSMGNAALIFMEEA